MAWLYFHDYQSPDPVPRDVGGQAEETGGRAPDHKARVDNDGGEGNEGTHETPLEVGPDAMPEDVPVDQDEAEPAPEEEVAVQEGAAKEADPADAEDPELQQAIFESCSTRPLTPLGRCVGLAPVMTTYKTAAGVFEEHEFPHDTFSYREPLLAHVEVYSFAKYHLLRPLQDLALQRMIITLRRLDCSVKHAEQELAEVIEFVYDNIPADRDKEEPARRLFSHFAAINFTSLMHGSFEVLVARGGDFGLDLARKLSRRLLAHRTSGKLADDESDRRIQALELLVQERDQEIRSLTADSDDCSAWGRGIHEKGRRRAERSAR